MTRPIRVLVVDDHAVVRRGLSAYLATRPEIERVGEAADGYTAVKSAAALDPDVIVMDLVMPGLDGVEAIRRIRDANPQARILVLTSFADDEKVYAAVESGALGYVLKEASEEELVRAILDVHDGRSYLSPALAHRLVRHMASRAAARDESPLTERETDVLKLLAHGHSNRELAARLVITERTAGTYVTSILDKLRLSNRTQAALYALRHGLARLDEDDSR